MEWKRLTSQNGKLLDSLPNTRFDNSSGLSGRTANGGRQKTRPVLGIDQNIKLNRALWLLADGMRQLKTG